MKVIHNEYQYKSETSDTILVFIHGILGSPSQFDFIIDKLQGEYSVENLLLPGHGKTAREFNNSGMAQWQEYVDNRIIQLQKEYKHMFLIGHSMGCLLSVQTALNYPQRCAGCFFLPYR